MAKILAYPLTVIYLILFGLTLLVFHPIQFICHRVFGYTAHKKSVSLLNLCLMGSTMALGTRYSFTNPYEIPKDRPLIIVTNHQSMYDIPPLIWFMRAHHPKFVSKKELGKGIPSVSYNLRHGGSVLIDRSNPEQAVKAIAQFGQYIEKTNRSAVIFPEGTRSRTGVPKPFRTGGIKTLMENAPSALLVPISINNSWKLTPYGKFPHGLGTHVKLLVHEPMELEGEREELLAKLERSITSAIHK